jgi:hypothetical protein
MLNKLIFHTPIGSVTFPPATARILAIIDVSKFDRIRVVALHQSPAGANAEVLLKVTGGPLLSDANLDILPLAPNSQVTRVYDVVCTELTLSAGALLGGGDVTLEVLFYGFQSR